MALLGMQVRTTKDGVCSNAAGPPRILWHQVPFASWLICCVVQCVCGCVCCILCVVFTCVCVGLGWDAGHDQHLGEKKNKKKERMHLGHVVAIFLLFLFLVCMEKKESWQIPIVVVTGMLLCVLAV